MYPEQCIEYQPCWSLLSFILSLQWSMFCLAPLSSPGCLPTWRALSSSGISCSTITIALLLCKLNVLLRSASHLAEVLSSSSSSVPQACMPHQLPSDYLCTAVHAICLITEFLQISMTFYALWDCCVYVVVAILSIVNRLLSLKASRLKG